jgi:hypothetical protein
MTKRPHRRRHRRRPVLPARRFRRHHLPRRHRLRRRQRFSIRLLDLFPVRPRCRHRASREAQSRHCQLIPPCLVRRAGPRATAPVARLHRRVRRSPTQHYNLLSRSVRRVRDRQRLLLHLRFREH